MYKWLFNVVLSSRKAQEIWTGLTHDKDALVSLMNEIENYFHNMNAKK